MMALPADEVLFAIGRRKMAYILPYLSVLGVAAIYAGTNYFGVYHSYLYYELTRYNSVVNLTNRIASEYPKQRYTIISTTDEIYQVIESGWHEEILDFYYKSKLEKYYIPTEYLFFYVERIRFNMHSTIFLQDQGGLHRKNIHSIISTPMR